MSLFFDPVFRAPLWGTLLMCMASSLIGVVLFLKKKTLLSESLSHAAYPGVAAGLLILGSLFPHLDTWAFAAVLGGAFLSSFLAFKWILFLQEKQKTSQDAALCFTLSLFFGAGILLLSAMQSFLPSWHKYAQMFLLGQAATMTDIHILLYGGLTLAVVVFVWLYFYPLQTTLFDRSFAKSLGLRVESIERLIFWLLLLSLIIGVRSVGVVLMSGMVVAPAIAARQFTHSLAKMFILSCLFGAMGGLLGNFVSIFGSQALSSEGANLTLPTGPSIILVSGLWTFLALFLAPQKGLVFRKLRIGRFNRKCLEENILKNLWKKKTSNREEMALLFAKGKMALFWILRRLQREGWIQAQDGLYGLTPDGEKRASSIVRLHRLWELYLADALKLEVEKVHKTAEEMEHILTPDLEKRLTHLLKNPKKDPHQQPIPQKEGHL